MKQRLRSLCVALIEMLENKSPSASCLVPVYIELDQLDSRLTGVPYHEGDLLRLLLNNLGFFEEEQPRLILKELLETFNMVLLLDGLNELPPNDQSACRSDLFRLDQALTASGKAQRLRIALSSRILGF